MLLNFHVGINTEVDKLFMVLFNKRKVFQCNQDNRISRNPDCSIKLFSNSFCLVLIFFMLGLLTSVAGGTVE